MKSSTDPNEIGGDRWLARWADRLARAHPRLGMLRFEEAIRRTMPRLMRQHLVPGVQISFSIGGASVRTLCFGMACQRSARAIEPSTVFRLSSVTKPFTAMGVLVLAQRGVVTLDESVGEDVATIFGAVSQEDRGRLKGLTLRRLLGHASGLAHFNPPRLDNACRAEWLHAATVRFECDPGTRSAYSGVNYALAEVVVENRTRKSFPVVMQELVLSPLGMTKSRFERDAARESELLSRDHDGSGIELESPASVCHASSGLVSSTEEVCRGLSACHFQGVLLPSKLAVLQRTAQPDGLKGATATLGFHLHRGVDERCLSHGGTRPGHRSLVVMVPGAQAVLCIAANGEGGAEVFKAMTGFFRAITVGA